MMPGEFQPELIQTKSSESSVLFMRIVVKLLTTFLKTSQNQSTLTYAKWSSCYYPDIDFFFSTNDFYFSFFVFLYLIAFIVVEHPQDRFLLSLTLAATIGSDLSSPGQFFLFLCPIPKSKAKSHCPEDIPIMENLHLQLTAGDLFEKC